MALRTAAAAVVVDMVPNRAPSPMVKTMATVADVHRLDDNSQWTMLAEHYLEDWTSFGLDFGLKIGLRLRIEWLGHTKHVALVALDRSLSALFLLVVNASAYKV